MEKEKALLDPGRASNALIFFAVTTATYARGLEGEVVGVRGFVHEVGGWGCWCGGSGCWLYGGATYCWSGGWCASVNWSLCVSWFCLPTTDAGVPAAVILAAFDVEAQLHHLAFLKVVLGGTVAEEVEVHLLWEVFLSFKHIFLLRPVVTCLGNASLQRQFQYDFTNNFH